MKKKEKKVRGNFDFFGTFPKAVYVMQSYQYFSKKTNNTKVYKRKKIIS